MLSGLHETKRDVSVIYLSWLPYGTEFLSKFIESYKKHPSGFNHKLYIILNGVGISDSKSKFYDLIQNNLPDAEVLELDNGQDIDAYFYAAAKVKSDILFFLNSFSEFQTADWLNKYMTAFDKSIGLLGTTASCQSLYSTALLETKKTLNNFRSLFQIRNLKMLLKALFYWRLLFSAFPNPHIRTTGWMIRRNDMMKVAKKDMKRKFNAYLFESGKNSLTNQIIRLGYEVAIIGKNGNVYTMEKWRESNTFWMQNQENVMITDNQTALYHNAEPSYKRYLNLLAWGDQ